MNSQKKSAHLSRREFLRLSGMIAYLTALNACQQGSPTLSSASTQAPTLISSPTVTPIPSATVALMPTSIATAIATPTPMSLRLRDIGAKLGIVIGTTQDGSPYDRDPNWRKTVGTYFASVMTTGAVSEKNLEKYGSSIIQPIRSLADEYNLTLHLHPGFWGQGAKESQKGQTLFNATRNEVKAFVEERLRTLYGFVRKIGDGYRPTFFNFLNEAMWWYKDAQGTDRTGWDDSPYYRAFGDRVIIELYLMSYRVAKEVGLDPGQDIVLLYCDFDLFAPGPKADFVYTQLARAKAEIATALKIPESQVPFGVAIQMHLYLKGKKPTGYYPVATKDAMIANFRRFAQLGEVHITEMDVTNTDTLEEVAAVTTDVFHAAIGSGVVKSINLWERLRDCVATPDPGWCHPEDQLFDPRSNYQPTKLYTSLFNTLVPLVRN